MLNTLTTLKINFAGKKYSTSKTLLAKNQNVLKHNKHSAEAPRLSIIEPYGNPLRSKSFVTKIPAFKSKI